MDDKQYEIILHHADCCIGDLQDNEEYEMCAAILKDAKRDLAAMRQPITAEALRAYGFEQRGWEWVLSRRYSMRYNTDDSQWEFGVGRMAGGGKGNLIGLVLIASPSNMYDLGELVRLLGGAA